MHKYNQFREWFNVSWTQMIHSLVGNCAFCNFLGKLNFKIHTTKYILILQNLYSYILLWMSGLGLEAQKYVRLSFSLWREIKKETEHNVTYWVLRTRNNFKRWAYFINFRTWSWEETKMLKSSGIQSYKTQWGQRSC